MSVNEDVIESLGAMTELFGGLNFYAKAFPVIYCNNEMVELIEILNGAWQKCYQNGTDAQREQLKLGERQNNKLHRYFFCGFLAAGFQYCCTPLIVWIVKKYILRVESEFSFGAHLG